MINKLIALLLCAGATWTVAAAEPNATILPAPDFSPGAEYADSARMFQGIPGIERAANGRLWATWYGGGVTENEHNYILLYTSGDDGKSWQRVLVLDPDGDGPVRAFDPCLWHDPDGKLWLFWAQHTTGKTDTSEVLAINTTDSGNAAAKWSSPRQICKGVMMNKPIVTADGRWLLPAAMWFTNGSSRVVVSSDHGKTFGELGAANIPEARQRSADEHMLVERKDGSLWLLARTSYGLGESVSTDGGKTWPDMAAGSIPHTVSRFFIRRLASGNLLLV
ncbi:MAG: sialidase family protein, partial [Verrucomicrobia bacterium]|nr:sialidase family protein [Verrucomicrobiota bacterium]